MATARTGSDALGYYLSGTPSAAGCGTTAGCLGGIRLATEWMPLEPIITDPIGPIIIQQVDPANSTGTGYLRATSTTALAYTAPGDTEGAETTVAANTSVLLQSGTTAKAVRVYRDSVYNANVLGGRMQLDYVNGLNNVLAMGDVSNADRVAGEDYYRAIFLHNHSSATISNVKIYIGTLGTQRATGSAQLSSSGAGTITTATASGFADWPTTGWAHIKDSGGTTTEIVYYTARTSTSLTVPAAGRAILGTTAAAGSATDLIDAVPGIRIGLETPAADGTIQTIADEETAPTSITWDSGHTSSTGLSVATLTAGAATGLWIHRQIPAGAVVNAETTSKIVVTFDYSAVTYTHPITGYYRIADTTLALYKLFVGVDADADFTGSPVATSATLPFTYVVTPPGAGTDELRCAVMQTNQYDLDSLNSAQWYTTFTIDTTGADVTDDISAPTGVTATSRSGGEVDVFAEYPLATDSDPADTWLYYVTTNGVDPDTATDTPTEVSMTQSGLARGNLRYTKSFGPYAYGTDFRVVVRAMRSSDSEESTNTAVTTLSVTTQYPIRANWIQRTGGGARGFARQATLDSYTYYDDPTNSCYLRMLPGESTIYGNTTELAFRGTAAHETTVRIPLDWDFYEATHSTSGASTPIEVVSATEVYINVNGTRRAKLDFTNNRIEANDYTFTETVESLPVIGPTHTTSTATYIQVFNAITGRWQPWIKVDSNGRLTMFGSFREGMN